MVILSFDRKIDQFLRAYISSAIDVCSSMAEFFYIYIGNMAFVCFVVLGFYRRSRALETMGISAFNLSNIRIGTKIAGAVTLVGLTGLASCYLVSRELSHAEAYTRTVTERGIHAVRLLPLPGTESGFSP